MKTQNNGRLTAAEIDALNKGDRVWQIGCRRAPDRELTVKSKGPLYITFSATIQFNREYQSLSNRRFMYRTREDMERDKAFLSQFAELIQVLSKEVRGDRISHMNRFADLVSASEIDSIRHRIAQRWFGSFGKWQKDFQE